MEAIGLADAYPTLKKMGTLRVLLAIMVVFNHLDLPFEMFDSRFAVQMFFLISGFYMSLVWNSRYKHFHNPIQTFYKSRALRIYPVYLLVLSATAVVAWCAMERGLGLPLMAQREFPIGASGLAFLTLSEITIFGMSLHLFLTRIADGGLEWTANFHLGLGPQIHHYDLVPQAWTLDLELLFYLLVPFILTNIRLMIALLSVSFLIRFGLWQQGLNSDPWTYRFFPSELAIFLLGALSQKFWYFKGARINEFVSTRFARVVIGLSPILIAISFNVIHKALGELSYWICYVVAFLAIPILFDISKDSTIDRWIGELSFPIYISHMLVIYFIYAFVGRADSIVSALLPTLVLSVGLSKIQNFIDGYRNTVVLENKAD